MGEEALTMEYASNNYMTNFKVDLCNYQSKSPKPVGVEDCSQSQAIGALSRTTTSVLAAV